MVQRRKRRPRCTGCGLLPELCACALFPTVRVATRLVIVQHVRERLKPTNTGRLLQRMVPDVVLVHFGMREPAFDETPFDDPFVDFRVLYPRDDAAVLGPGAGGQRDPGRRLGFVVLDGTWHQCSRMSRRVPRVRDFECVALPPGRRSIWTVRTQHDPRGMSTFEAAIRLIEAVEGPEVIAPLQHAFEIVTARALFMKGKLSSPDVPDPWPVV